MSTLAELDQQGALHKLDPQLGPREQEERLIYASPKFAKWVADELPGLGSDRALEVLPAGQLDALFADFTRGKALTYDHQFKPLHPRSESTWELKTADLRIFGWFACMDCFIAVVATTKAFILEHEGIVAGYVGEVVRFRNLLDLDPPKLIEGDDPNAVVSNYDRAP